MNANKTQTAVVVCILVAGLLTSIWISHTRSSTLIRDNSFIQYYAEDDPGIRLVIAYPYGETLKAPVIPSRVTLESRSEGLYLWSYVPVDTPLSSVTILKLQGATFLPSRGAISDGSFTLPVSCSMRHATTSEAARLIVQDTFHTLVKEDDVILGARVIENSGWPYSEALPGDSVWTLIDKYMKEKFGHHFVDAPQQERIEMIDWIKDGVVNKSGPHNIENGELVFVGQGLDGSFLLGGSAECFWMIKDEKGKRFIVTNDGEAKRPEEFHSFNFIFRDYD